MSHRELVEGSSVTFRANFVDSEVGTAINLTGATVAFLYRIGSGTLKTKLTPTDVVVTDATGGKAECTPPTTDVTVGFLRYEWRVTDSTGKIHKMDRPPFEMKVRANL